MAEIIDRNCGTVFKCLADKFSYFVQLARPADYIQVSTALADCLGCSLCHAADYADDPGPAEASLVIVEMAKSAEDLFLGVLAHRAGVDQGDLGVAELVYQAKALGLELVGNQLGVKLVHLAAGGFDVNGSCHFVQFAVRAWGLGFQSVPSGVVTTTLSFQGALSKFAVFRAAAGVWAGGWRARSLAAML